MIYMRFSRLRPARIYLRLGGCRIGRVGALGHLGGAGRPGAMAGKNPWQVGIALFLLGKTLLSLAAMREGCDSYNLHCVAVA